MNDIPKQTVEDLITYMYNGQVEIPQESLADFLKKAKSLEIEGITDDNYRQTIDQDRAASMNGNNHLNHGRIQYQTMQVNRLQTSKLVCNENSTILASESAYQPEMNTSNHASYQYPSSSDFSDESNESAYDAYVSTNQDYDAGNAQWGQEYEDDDDQEFYKNQGPVANTPRAPPTKRAKRTNFTGKLFTNKQEYKYKLKSNILFRYIRI